MVVLWIKYCEGIQKPLKCSVSACCFSCTFRPPLLISSGSLSLFHTANEGRRIGYKCLVPIMYSQKWNCAAPLFPKQNYNVLSRNFYTHTVYLREIYIFSGPFCLFCCSQICVIVYWSWEYKNCSQTYECRNWDWDSAFSFWEHINWIFGTVQEDDAQNV